MPTTQPHTDLLSFAASFRQLVIIHSLCHLTVHSLFQVIWNMFNSIAPSRNSFRNPVAAPPLIKSKLEFFPIFLLLFCPREDLSIFSCCCLVS